MSSLQLPSFLLRKLLDDLYSWRRNRKFTPRHVNGNNQDRHLVSPRKRDSDGKRDNESRTSNCRDKKSPTWTDSFSPVWFSHFRSFPWLSTGEIDSDPETPVLRLLPFYETGSARSRTGSPLKQVGRDREHPCLEVTRPTYLTGSSRLSCNVGWVENPLSCGWNKRDRLGPTYQC